MHDDCIHDAYFVLNNRRMATAYYRFGIITWTIYSSSLFRRTAAVVAFGTRHLHSRRAFVVLMISSGSPSLQQYPLFYTTHRKAKQPEPPLPLLAPQNSQRSQTKKYRALRRGAREGVRLWAFGGARGSERELEPEIPGKGKSSTLACLNCTRRRRSTFRRKFHADKLQQYAVTLNISDWICK